MIELLLAGALLTATMQDPPPPQEEPVALEDVTVTGRSLDSMIDDFVDEVAEPNRRRGLARWDRSVCVGVANLRAQTAQYLVDRISTVAEDLGLEPGAPGCKPNLLIIATDDAGGLTRTLVETRPRAFRMGGSGMDRGGDALEDFVAKDRPIRWWQMAMPVDSETGDWAIRIPGECRGACMSPMDSAPQISVFAASRLRTQMVNTLVRTVVIVDFDQVQSLTLLQLADYIAMVSLAQVDPDADTSAYASILNVLDDPQSADALMDWDVAYLGGLYSAERNAVSRAANRGEISDSIRHEHRRMREERGDGDDGGDGEGVTP